jgi:hypothetical protein
MYDIFRCAGPTFGRGLHRMKERKKKVLRHDYMYIFLVVYIPVCTAFHCISLHQTKSEEDW